jgi:hypothetical protein
MRVSLQNMVHAGCMHGTHRVCKLVRAPHSGGSVPFSLLSFRYLQATHILVNCDANELEATDRVYRVLQTFHASMIQLLSKIDNSGCWIMWHDHNTILCVPDSILFMSCCLYAALVLHLFSGPMKEACTHKVANWVMLLQAAGSVPAKALLDRNLQGHMQG